MSAQLERKKCFVCGGDMIPQKIDVKSQWGDYCVTISGVTVYECDKCGEKVYLAKDAEMMQKLTRAFADSAEEKPDLLNLEETAKILRVSNQTIYNMIRDGRIKAHKIGREWRFLKSDILPIESDIDQNLSLAASGGIISENDRQIISELIDDGE